MWVFLNDAMVSAVAHRTKPGQLMVRARLAGDLIMGVAISRAITDDHDLDAEGQAALRQRLAKVIQAAIEP